MLFNAKAHHPVTTSRARRRQDGVTLLELLVGIAIGLLVVAVATGALMVSRSVSGTVSDASGIQQQSAYIMRIIGLQLRQAGSLYLNLNPSNAASATFSAIPVAFEAKVPASGSGNGFNPATDTLSGASNSLTVGYRRYTEPVYTSASAQSLARNCIGGPADSSLDQQVQSIFQLNGTDLRCSGNGSAAEPIAQNVADFQVRYLVQDNSAPGNTKLQYLGAASVTNWSQVQAVEVCIVLFGAESIDMPAGSTYVGCGNDPTPANNLVDMTTLTGARARRMHIAYRNVFQLRSQGLVGTVL